jgi:Uma2 family endonuclease
MAAPAEPLLTTVEQYRELPERNDALQELHWGQVVTLTRPKMGHTKLQYRLVELLRPIAEQHGIVASEVPFRALPEYDLRGADVAFVSQTRWNATQDDDNLRGSPELVIEILSPSNTSSEIREKAALCLSTGTEEFWVVDPKRKSVSVARPSGETVVYGIGNCIPLSVLGGMVEVRDIFNG